MPTRHIAIIGGGAAGCFAAINLRRMLPDAEVTVLESRNKPLAKVAVTGGGRCNITNSFREVRSIASVYPRGERIMRRLLREFSHEDTCRWFENEGVRLMTQADQCVFPASQDAMEIVCTLTRMMRENGVRLRTGCRAERIECAESGGFTITCGGEEPQAISADTVIVATGGFRKSDSTAMFGDMRIEMAEPVPSLFGLCLPEDSITGLTGIVVDNVSVGLTGTKHRATGPLLITHWGMSGPAILRLSSYAARTLHENGYKAQLCVNWLGDLNENEAAGIIADMAAASPNRQLSTAHPPMINSRLWQYLLLRCGLRTEQKWSATGKKTHNRIASALTGSIHNVDGKNRFKEEFVTCGGVALSNVSQKTLECRNYPGLFFAGEALDIDAVTGGFNLQAAWTTGYVAAKAAAKQQL